MTIPAPLSAALPVGASESRAELFEMDYFDTTAYLAQSPQFFKQMAQSAGFGKIFEIAPAFRAAPPFTARHATEFTSVDMEVSWIDNHEDVMAIHEQLLKVAIDAVIAAHGEEINQLLDVELLSPPLPLPRVPLSVCALVKEKFGSDFVFVTDYDASIRPFYHMRPETNRGLTNSYDLLYDGTEISTGAQREHRVDVHEKQAQEKGLSTEDLEHYLDFFRHGAPSHGGFGMGWPEY